MKVYFVRHGESQFNTTRRHQHKDVPLTEKGIAQADALAQRLKNQPVKHILSSRYERAAQTAAVIGETLDVPVVYSDFLYEVKVPSELAGKTTRDEETLKINQQLIDNFTKGDWRYSDEETFNDLKTRARAVLSQITKEQHDAMIVVAHARFIRFLLAMIMFGETLKPEDYMGLWCLELSNSGVSVCDYVPENAEYNNNNPWRVITINDHSHLP
jgi:probable phosphoglycerate mutase